MTTIEQLTGTPNPAGEWWGRRAPVALLLQPNPNTIVHVLLSEDGILFKSAGGQVAVPLDEIVRVCREAAPEVFGNAPPLSTLNPQPSTLR